jgi:hypothetical protein
MEFNLEDGWEVVVAGRALWERLRLGRVEDKEEEEEE